MSLAEKFGFAGACQLSDVILISNDEGNAEFKNNAFEETTVKALMENEVTTELHVYPKFNHGLATADLITNSIEPEDVKTWINHAIYFIKNRV